MLGGLPLSKGVAVRFECMTDSDSVPRDDPAMFGGLPLSRDDTVTFECMSDSDTVPTDDAAILGELTSSRAEIANAEVSVFETETADVKERVFAPFDD